MRKENRPSSRSLPTSIPPTMPHTTPHDTLDGVICNPEASLCNFKPETAWPGCLGPSRVPGHREICHHPCLPCRACLKSSLPFQSCFRLRHVYRSVALIIQSPVMLITLGLPVFSLYQILNHLLPVLASTFIATHPTEACAGLIHIPYLPINL